LRGSRGGDLMGTPGPWQRIFFNDEVTGNPRKHELPEDL